jgi:hypothetical protein
MTLLAAALLLAAGIPASAGPSQGGNSTDNVEYVDFFPFEIGSATGANFWNEGKNKYMLITGWKTFSIYDITDPLNPQIQGTPVPLGFEFENEDVAVNGKIMLFSESTPNDVLHVWNIEDKTNPVLVTDITGAGDHTTSCVLDCKYAYGSDGTITDFSNPTKPKVIAFRGDKNNWHAQIELQGGAHDIQEYKPGFGVVSTLDATPIIADLRDPAHVKVIARGDGPEGWSGERGFLWHSGAWPNQGKSRWVLMQGEDNANPRCQGTSPTGNSIDKRGPFSTFDAKNVKKTHTITMTDTYMLDNGTFTDGSPPVNGLGCSAHWFSTRDDFNSGGVVALAYYEHGTRFLNVDSATGKIKELGWFIPIGGSTSAAKYVSHDIVYSIDYTRGIDILRFSDK